MRIDFVRPFPVTLTVDKNDPPDLALFFGTAQSDRKSNDAHMESSSMLSAYRSPDGLTMRVPVMLASCTFEPIHGLQISRNKSIQDLRCLRMQFASEPGRRHIIQINGQRLRGFENSDLRFLRLLRLALERCCGKDDGWLDKEKLRSCSDKGLELEKIRRAIRRSTGSTLTALERRALIETRRGCRTRIGVQPANIVFDPSLARLVLLGTRKKKRTPDQDAGLNAAAQLLKDCRKVWMSLPGFERDVTENV